ncbi:hypothetical protein RHGRI_018290 [Rhododendron griersonianum]|uniref:Bulb-type lectin domain-containing protein n=1 Tax=Rhododendron griersonianum TaxID=479676 RepID=A0AAV6K0V0_9ERIC|nr:hypothetical protein RHGRI_018290 [Rhododendron griersonianum]
MATAGLMKNWVLILLLILLPLFSHFPCGTEAYYADFPSTNLSVSWQNTPFNEQGSLDFVDGTTLRPILLVYNITKSYPPFGLGFFAQNTSTPDSGFYVVVFMMTGVNAGDNNFDGEYQFSPYMPPQVLWSANRDIPVGENATLNFTGEGDLVLKDEFGNPVWSTNTSTSYVARMEIDVSGNFMLLNGSNGVVWQSFDNPTDTWLPNQKIYNGQRLTASNSSSDLSTGIYYLAVDKDNKIGMRAFLDSNPPQQYAIFLAENIVGSLVGPAFGSPNNGVKLATTFAVFYFNFTASPSDYRFIVLEPNGHLILYLVDTSYPYTYAVMPRKDLLAAIDSLGDCSYPAVCGHYGVCSGGGQCGCPEDSTGTSNYFWPFKQGVGCAQITPLSCKDGSKYHTFVDLPNVTYFDFVPTLFATTIDECKEACLNNCSCKAALFWSVEPRWRMKQDWVRDVESGEDHTGSGEGRRSQARVAGVRRGSPESGEGRRRCAEAGQGLDLRQASPEVRRRLARVVGGVLVAGEGHGVWVMAGSESLAEIWWLGFLGLLFTVVTLFTTATNFQIRLGQGGFGAVFEGVLSDGIKVAVKQLDSIVQGRKEFLAEVNTIGKVEHFQSQFAQSPYDADGFQAADQMVVLDLKKRFNESSPEKTQLWAEIQEQKSLRFLQLKAIRISHRLVLLTTRMSSSSSSGSYGTSFDTYDRYTQRGRQIKPWDEREHQGRLKWQAEKSIKHDMKKEAYRILKDDVKYNKLRAEVLAQPYVSYRQASPKSVRSHYSGPSAPPPVYIDISSVLEDEDLEEPPFDE